MIIVIFIYSNLYLKQVEDSMNLILSQPQNRIRLKLLQTSA